MKRNRIRTCLKATYMKTNELRQSQINKYEKTSIKTCYNQLYEQTYVKHISKTEYEIEANQDKYNNTYDKKSLKHTTTMK